MRLPLSSLVAGLALALASFGAAAQKTQLLVYTALETDQLKAYQEGFNKVHPDIEIKWVRDSTGVITAKLLAEKSNPQADAVMGVAASSLALLDKNGMLEPYKPINLDAIMSQYRDKKNPPAWFGMDVWGATVCFNTVEAQKKGIPKPETWKDLTKPAYKGQIVMPNPASSGTGYFDVTAWLALWGDDNGKGGGWKFMDALHENIAQYTHSGSKPCNMAASGAATPGCAVIAKFLPYSSMASLLLAQSASLRAASSFLVPLWMAKASRSQPRPSLGNTRSMGAPLALLLWPRYSNEMPTVYSPAAAMLQGLEPECVYCAMFSCRPSMYFQPPPLPLSSPHSVSQALTSKKPVPDEAGLGITMESLYTGLARSAQEVGLGRFFFGPSTVL